MHYIFVIFMHALCSSYMCQHVSYTGASPSNSVFMCYAVRLHCAANV